MAIAVLLCARCGSHLVDVAGWRDRQIARIRCTACDHEAAVDGFTVGRVHAQDERALLVEAIQDAAMPNAAVVLTA